MGYTHQRPFPPPFATFAAFFVSQTRIFMSLFPGEGQNRTGWHNLEENWLQNLPLQASPEGRSRAPTGTSKLGGSDSPPDERAVPPGACRLFTSVHDGELWSYYWVGRVQRGSGVTFTPRYAKSSRKPGKISGIFFEKNQKKISLDIFFKRIR